MVRIEEQLIVIAGGLRLIDILLLLLVVRVFIGARLVLPQRVQAITFLFALDRSTAELFRSITMRRIIGGAENCSQSI